jgi:hypothetical protein
MEIFGITITLLYGAFFAVCLVLIIYLIIKRINKKEDFENRDN